MAAYIIYCIKVAACLTLFYAAYKVLLSRETFFSLNRKVLIAGLMVCFALPLLKVHTEKSDFLQKTFISMETFLSTDASIENENTSATIIPSRASTISTRKPIMTIQWLSVVYILGLSFTLCCSAASFLSLWRLIRKGVKTDYEGFRLVLVQQPIIPFNWGNMIVMWEKDYSDNRDELLAHESMHLRQHHSVDLLLMEVVLVLQWFNPAAWLIKRELTTVHEYAADRGVIDNGIDAIKYQLLLVKKAAGSGSYTFTSSFNHSKIKKRITMMLKKKSNKWARTKLVFLVPVAAFAMAAFARQEADLHLSSIINHEDTAISLQQSPSDSIYFKTELDKYFAGLNMSDASHEKKLDAINANTDRIMFLVNSENEILLNNRYAKMPEVLQIMEDFMKNHKGNRPVSVIFLADRGSSPETVKEAKQLIRKAYASYLKTPSGANQPVIVPALTSKDFSLKNRRK